MWPAYSLVPPDQNSKRGAVRADLQSSTLILANTIPTNFGQPYSHTQQLQHANERRIVGSTLYGCHDG